MIEIGRICLKIAGRDAGKQCVIVDNLENSYVMIDGETRRKRCNVKHLEPLNKILKIKQKASHEDIVKEFKSLGIEIKTTTPKTNKTDKPLRKRKSKVVADIVKSDKKSKKSSSKKK